MPPTHDAIPRDEMRSVAPKFSATPPCGEASCRLRCDLLANLRVLRFIRQKNILPIQIAL